MTLSSAVGRRLRRMPLLRGLAGCDADLTRIIRPDWTVIDVGCGAGSRSAPYALDRAIGIDLHFASLVQSQRAGTRSAAVCASLKVLPLADSAVDAVVALDVIEHFTRDDAVSVMGELERVARKAVVLLTPNGYLPQAGTRENPFMEHRSGWSPADLRQYGYTVSGVNGWRPLRGAHASPRLGSSGKILSLASQPLIRRHPEHAFHLLALKTL